MGEQEFKGYLKSSFFIIDAFVHSPFEEIGQRRKVTICNSGDTNIPCPLDEGVYEVSSGRSEFVITKVGKKTIEELKEMNCLNRYNILPTASKK